MAEINTIEKPTRDEVVSLLKAEFGSKVTFHESTKKNIKSINEGRRVFVKAEREILYDLAKYLHDRLNFEHASSVLGVDRIDYMQVVYHLTNYFSSIVIEVTVDVPNDDLRVPSVALIWEGANWHERETYELFGIVFEGHPKLERLLTPKSYEFYPFRKSYKLRGQE